MRLAVRLLVLIAAVLGLGVAFAWAWDRADTRAQTASGALPANDATPQEPAARR